MEELPPNYYKKTQPLYSYGLPFEKCLGVALEQQIKRVEIENKPSLIILDGACGSGKTTLAVEVGDFVNKYFKQDLIDLGIKSHIQIGLGGKEFTKNFRKVREAGLHIIIYDEAGDFSRYGAISGFNAMINRLFETYRGFKILVVVCLPNFNILDNRLFDNKIPRLLLHCENRKAKYGSFKAYSLSQMNWVRYWFDKLPKGAKHKCYDNVDPNFRGNFLNLSPERIEILDKLSTHGKEMYLGKAEIDLEGYINYLDIAEKLRLNVDYVRQIMLKLKIKEKATVNKTKYFDKSTVSYLVEHLEAKKNIRKEGKLIEKVNI